MPETIPSYEEATAPVDWLDLAGPSISIRDYARLCRVSRHFCDYFLPRLWADPFAICYALEPNPMFGMETEPRIEQFCRIVPLARLSTLSLVLAFRPRVKDWLELEHFGAVGSDTCSPSNSFPNLRCMAMLDETHDRDSHLGIIQHNRIQFPNDVWVLAARRCFQQLPVQWPAPENLENVIYYDDSRIHQIHPTLPPFNGRGMLRLRILKLAGHNMGDDHALDIIGGEKFKIWSLDLSGNGLTSRFLPKNTYDHPRSQGTRKLIDGSCRCFAHDLRDDLEGFLCSARFAGFFVHETCYTENPWLSHPHKYHQDSPKYVSARDYDVENGVNAELRGVRTTAVLDDSLDAVVKAICSQKHVSLIKSLDICQPPVSGITHLYLNQNPNLTTRALQSVVLELPHLQRLECDPIMFITPNTMFRYNRLYQPQQAVPASVSRSKDQAISGILGLSHLFRPLFVNLQILRIHHSLVTNLPELTEFDDLSDMEKIWFAEAFLLPRADLMFPNPFHPDMNPRLRSLTLTHIPRYSTGPLIERLKGLLKAAWFQEQTISKLRAEHRRLHQTRYEPPLLSGLRKIVLEFDPDPRCQTTQGGEQTGLESFDAEALLNSGAKEFGTFGGFTASSNGSRGSSATRRQSAVRHANANRNGPAGSSRQQPQHGSQLHRRDSETSGVRAASNSHDQNRPKKKDERPQIQLGKRLAPLYMTYDLGYSGLPKDNTKVFIGYRYSTGQESYGQSQEQKSVSASVFRSNSREPADGNGASSSSGQVPAFRSNHFDEVSRLEAEAGEKSQMHSSPLDEGSTDRLQSLDLNPRLEEGSSPSQTQPDPDSFIPDNHPPPYTGTAVSVPGRSFEGSFIHPPSFNLNRSGSTTPTPSSSDGTSSLYPTVAKPPPLPTSPDAIYPIPPCFFAYPHYLSLAEQQASLNYYHNRISRILVDQIGPTAPAEFFDSSSSVRDPPHPFDSSAGSSSASASYRLPATITGRGLSSGSSPFEFFFRFPGPRQKRSFSDSSTAEDVEEYHRKLQEVLRPKVEQIQACLDRAMTTFLDVPQAATPSMVRAGVPCQSFKQALGDGGGAGCLVFGRVWEGGLFGDFFVPGDAGEVGGEGDRENGHGREDAENGHGRGEHGSEGGDTGAGAGATGRGNSTAGTNNGGSHRGRRSTVKGSSTRGRNLLREDMRRPTRHELAQMKDVIQELKKFRALTGGTAAGGAATATAATATRLQNKGNGQNGSHQNGSHQNGSHQNGSHQNGSHQNGSHQNGSHQNGSQQHTENGQIQETKTKPKPTAKDKGKGKAVDYGDGDEDKQDEQDVKNGKGWEDGNNDDDDSKWAGKHWMGELVVIRNLKK